MVDATFCADFAFAERLARDGRVVRHLPHAVQPSLHNPFLDLADREAGPPELLFLGWTSVLSDQRLADDSPAGAARLAHRRARGAHPVPPESQPPALADAILGSVGLRDRLFLLKHAGILIQADDDLTPRRSAERAALEAAACQCVVLDRGALDPGDARTKFAKSFRRWSDLRAFVARLQSDWVLWLRLAQLGWRTAQEEFAIAGALTAIFAATGIATALVRPPRQHRHPDDPAGPASPKFSISSAARPGRTRS